MLKKVTLVFSCVICFLLATFVFISPVSALEAGDVVIRVEPAEQDISLTPGETSTGIIKVQNIGRLDFDFTVMVRPFQILNDDYDPDFDTDNNYTRLQNWISFEQTDYHLAPGAEAEVKYTVDVPTDAPGGGQYAAIIAQTRSSIDESSMMHTISQVASILYAQVDGDTRFEGSLTNHHLPSNILFGTAPSIVATVKNTGNADFRVTHRLSVYNFFTGKEVFSADATDESGNLIGTATPRIMPGTERSNIITWQHAPQIGVFRVVQDISFLDEQHNFEQIVILCPFWLVGGIIFMIFLMILWLILRLRSRRHSQPQVI